MQPAPAVVEKPSAEDVVLRMMLAMNRRFRARVDGDVVDASQAGVLHALKAKGPIRLGDLAEAMHLDASTVSRHVQQLCDRGLIERGPDPQDGRARIIAISDAGRDGLRCSFDLRRAVITEAMADWTDEERDRLRDDLLRLDESLG
ncbi:MarR family winged helix-turn-helix transcriptional regulator [Aeromicrobium wangtongii]|uniref:MarR family transcriptional regulator n=1 Tax=Aeromicrobium wangtongii TaxID=2969247 RepID=A0ABY5MBI1_9ACTN|nr:MarR family transcriptional regulator [Aeromicrobium wangtongii]MCD9196927.1 MarR family transcriptional regulator [Aeromicrobium wangtongii]UUP14433.1 MarR family transcriptional regulator [Aeromicrobium wangtongii]